MMVKRTGTVPVSSGTITSSLQSCNPVGTDVPRVPEHIDNKGKDHRDKDSINEDGGNDEGLGHARVVLEKTGGNEVQNDPFPHDLKTDNDFYQISLGDDAVQSQKKNHDREEEISGE
jgi:hypothetical protein